LRLNGIAMTIENVGACTGSFRPRGNRPLRLGTRGSPLALAQANRVARQLREQCGRTAVLVTVATSGDESAAPIERLGTTGAFTSTLREAPARDAGCNRGYPLAGSGDTRLR
jgi:hypothetical protein